MAEPATFASPPRQFDLRELFRVALWGIGAAGALALATFISSSETGNDRMLLALAHIRGGAEPPVQVARADDAETRRLFETVRTLAADNDRLQARLDTLQRNVEDMTGSIARVAARPAPPLILAAPAPAPVPIPVLAPPVIAVPIATPPVAALLPEPAPMLSAPATTASLSMPMPTPPNVWANVPVPRPAPQPPQTQAAAPVELAPPPPASADRAEFGIDLGVAPTMEGLRALWNAVRAKHATQLEGLRPIVALRERAGAGGVDLRLVIGPLPSAAAAARLCATLGTVSATCQPAMFEGQRLALR